MSANDSVLEQIVTQVQKLSIEDRLRLIMRVLESLIPTAKPTKPKQIVYGQFKGEGMSTAEDFQLAEWRPPETEMNGT